MIKRYKDPTGDIVKKLIEMQKLYINTENQFQQFNHMVPYVNNQYNVHSPVLVELIRNIGPQIYGMFELISKQLELIPTNDKFPTYYDLINSESLLEKQGIILNENKELRKPFGDKKNIPWWENYNDMKHNLLEKSNSTTLEHVIDALGALFILHHLADCFQTSHNPKFSLDADLLNSENWIRVETRDQYVHYEGKMGKNTTLYESIPSIIFTIYKRYMPLLRDKQSEITYPTN